MRTGVSTAAGTRLAFVVVLAVVAPLVALGPAGASHDVTTPRLAGADRFDTAARIASATYPAGRPVALLARGDDFADALAAAPLARQAAAPILLTERDRLPAPTARALADLGVEEIVLLGGPGAIGRGVAAQLAQDHAVTRVAGASRFETAAEIARAIALGGDVGVLEGRRTVFVASGASFPDALAIAAPAASQDDPFPILLTERDRLHPAAAAAIGDVGAEQAVIVGGTAVVAGGVEAELAAAGLAVRRLSGPNRLATAAAVADFTIAHTPATGEVAFLARGDLFPDALAAGPHAGLAGAPILLAAAPDRLGIETGRWLDSACLLLRSVPAAGGAAAVSGAVLAEAASTARDCHGSWGFISPSPLAPRVNHTAVWTGETMLIWGGGQEGGFELRDDGASWDPAARSWQMVPAAPIEPRWHHEAAWTGAELLVWGGNGGAGRQFACLRDGAAYEPATGQWRTLPPAPGPCRAGAAPVWTGEQFVLFGGVVSSSGPYDFRRDGIAYDLAADSWSVIPPAPIEGRADVVAAWTGSELVVFGGHGRGDPYTDGAANDPEAGTWRLLPPTPVQLMNYNLDGGWTGAELVALSGERRDAAVFDPVADAWRQADHVPGRIGPNATATFADGLLYFVGGEFQHRDGLAFAAYDLAADAWVTLPEPPGGARSAHTTVFTGAELLVWGGLASRSDLAPAVTWRPHE